MNIPDELARAVKDDNLVVFIGAGLSFNFNNIQGIKLEGWTNLLKHMIFFLEKRMEKTFFYDNLMSVDDPYDILDIFDDLDESKKLPKKQLTKFVKDFCKLSPENNFELHKKLYKLSKIIVTTNYDNAFELANLYSNENIFTYKNLFDFKKRLNTNESILLKIHGCCNSRKGMLVLFSEEYDMLYLPGIKIYQNMSMQKLFNFKFNRKVDECMNMLEATMHTIHDKHILFIGYGMNEVLINMMLAFVTQNNKNKHFVITKNSLVDIPIKKELKDYVTPITIGDFKEIDKIVDYLIFIKNTTANSCKISAGQFSRSEIFIFLQP